MKLKGFHWKEFKEQTIDSSGQSEWAHRGDVAPEARATEGSYHCPGIEGAGGPGVLLPELDPESKKGRVGGQCPKPAG